LEEASLLDDCEEERVPFKQQQRSGWRPPTLPPLSVRLPQLTGAALGSSSEVLSPRAGPHRYAAVAGASAVEEQEAFSPVRERMASGNKIAPMVDTRQSHCNEPDKNAAVAGGTVSNMVVTAKYTTASFLPKNLFEQFSRLANVYFLLISCLQIFTPLSPTSKYSTAAPLALVLMLNMVRELWEDSARHKADEEVNSRTVEVVRPSGQTESVAWRALVLGDMVRVKSNNEFPADLVLLSSSGDQGMCYIDTCNLDGETNLKIRNSIPDTSRLVEASMVAALRGTLEFEPPNNRLYTFSGKLVCAGREDVPVDNDNVLLRGATLRNTEWIFGQVIYVGPESKIMVGAAAAPRARACNGRPGAGQSWRAGVLDDAERRLKPVRQPTSWRLVESSTSPLPARQPH
jgi:magnesium-transporting ATPase (P-type)